MEVSNNPDEQIKRTIGKTLDARRAAGHQPERSLYNYGYRYYGTNLGRCLSRDPIEERGGKNLYGLVGNDPVSRWDGLGLVGKRAKRCCCCCAEDLNIDYPNIKLIDDATLWGHNFKITFKLNYKVSTKSSDCTLEWWERTDKPYTPAMKLKGPMVWNDMTKDPASKSFFDSFWGRREKPCPGRETIPATDQPAIPKGLWRTYSSILQFAIVLRSGNDCPCDEKFILVFATQKLSVKNGNGDQQSFEPGGVEGPWPAP